MLNISADGTTMSWEWHRNQDGVDIVTDSVTFVRDTTACPTRGRQLSCEVVVGHTLARDVLWHQLSRFPAGASKWRTLQGLGLTTHS